MVPPNKSPETLAPAVYQIRVQGRLDPGWSDWFDGMVVSYETSSTGPPTTLLTGPVPDQPALHGQLSRIRDLGLLLISVQRMG